MPEPVLETRNLNKIYVKRPVVRDLNLQVRPGEVYALVGPNGAGKTTVIRLLTGLAFPSSGTVRLLGGDPHRQPEVRRGLGAVVEAPAAFYPYLTGRANLQLQARLVGGVSDERISSLLELMQLGPAADRRVSVYSLGMRQRLGVAAAVLAEPEVLILDEPASGMDPLSLQLVHQVLRDAALRGAAVLLSTHHLEEVVSYCTHVGIMEAGALIDQLDLRDRGERYRARVSDSHTAAVALKMQPFVLKAATRGSDLTFTLTDQESLGRVAPVILDAGVELLELAPDVFNLRAYYSERMAARRTRKQAEVPVVGVGQL